MVKIICAGLRRSGSTWLYNVVRQILISQGIEVRSKFVRLPEDVGDANVLKMHSFNQEIAESNSLILLTIRDFKEVVASCIKRNKINYPDYQMMNDMDQVIDFKNLESIGSFLELEKQNYLQWKPYCDMVIPYHFLKTNKIKAIEEISSYFSLLQVNANEIGRIVEGIKPPSIGLDPQTELWANHITNSNCDELPATVSNYIENNFGDYLEDRLQITIG